MTPSEQLHPPRILWTFHGTILIKNYQEALAWLGKMCGCVALQYREAGAPVYGKGGCCWIADNMLEFVEPLSEDAPSARHLQRLGPCLYNIAVQIEDLAEAAKWLESVGAPPTTSLDNGFTFTRPSATMGLQIEWSERESDFDPRFGAALPQGPVSLIDVRRIAWWGALAENVAKTVERLQELWDAPLLFEKSVPSLTEPAAAFSLSDGVFAIYQLPRDIKEEKTLWGTALGRSRLHAIAFRTQNLSGAANTLSAENVRTLRGSANSGEIVTHPDDTLGLTFVWTDQDIENDPRLL